jgi:hypothetical protein
VLTSPSIDPAPSAETRDADAALEAELIAEMTPLIADLAVEGNGAVALGGSRAKGRSDARSDYDFRVYADGFEQDRRNSMSWNRFEAAMAGWEARGFRTDGVWPRVYANVQRDLSAWLAGSGTLKTFEWTIWGYHLPTDIFHQQIISDPRGTLAGWKQQLATYPDAMRDALVSQNMEILRYWATDYHYASKVARRDLVFLVGLTGKLANTILQVVFAHNRTYFPGDGWNLAMAEELPRLPPDFHARMTAFLEPDRDPGGWERQRMQVIEIISDLEVLTAE